MTNALIAFARAVGWGTLAGAVPYMALLLAPMLLSLWDGEDPLSAAMLVLFPLALSGAFVLGSALLFGLPLTFFLSESAQEHGGTYAMAGAVLGLLMPVAVTLSMSGSVGGEVLFLSLPGGFAGLVTGTSWGRWREAQRAVQDAL
ncbi:hypothetical protein ACLBKT_16800 [Erythrobacter sp. W302b]|uniref:hypothetical protein n=1 Tax=Erythrobacter sp. W302b TaxID=3389874 RepID=UPI00396B20CB